MTVERTETAASAEITEELIEQAEVLEQLMHRLMVAERSAFMQEVAQFGLTVPQYFSLAAVETFEGGKERMGRIASMAHQCSATMTGIIDRLEGMGLVRRQSNPEDRRSVLVELTDAGRQKLEEVQSARRQRLARILASIEPEARKSVYEVLCHYANALEVYEH